MPNTAQNTIGIAAQWYENTPDDHKPSYLQRAQGL